ncbi:hypothetical protein BVRB_7g179680 [Beta vulgaris subsp. vulgaris]|uniref:non-specific serine/threonine protein kinase n=1 Tax=Beta vulgaris subsp. vulgaris TaxID=3555 RepID=A0A0J8B7R2_BETVV|nr:hypothetical protein BVRB_7g179680 [Beta vulgaris subsp. vulgaris]
MEIWVLGFSIFLCHVCFSYAQMQGFVSLDCGGTNSHTDELGIQWVPDDQFQFGQTANISIPDETHQQYMTLRYFPNDNRKYCYTLNVTSRTRYLVRATFLYGNFDNNNVYPKFDVSMGPTPWSTIVISDASTVEMIEMIFLAIEPTISVCLSNATTGQPFISTLELRQFNGSMYIADFENQYYMSVSARINFGADSADPVRYPDDPYDRVWESDSVKKPNFLVDVASGTEKISTKMPINVDRDDRPPQKVMQTAVVGRNGTLSYRLNLDGFPGGGWAFTYFAEIEDIGPNDVRKFRLVLPDAPQASKAAVNILENAQGKDRLYEPGFMNLTLPFVLSFRFVKTSDSTLGPLVNAMEINKYLKRNGGTLDGSTITKLISQYSSADWAQEGGDPCLPVPWSWLECNSDPQPLVTAIHLSRKNLTGNIPSELTNLGGLIELWLDGNSLNGSVPDFSGCPNLKIIHLENNQLTGSVPSSLGDLQNLKELYLQNNRLSGKMPSNLGSDLVSNFSGNVNLRKASSGTSQTGIIVGSSIGAAVLLIATILSCLFLRKGKNSKKRYNDQARLRNVLPSQKLSSSLENTATEAAHCFTFSELEEATKDFEKKIGSGGYGVVYYGKLKDGREIAVKVLTSNSFQGKREFSNEVTLLSRIHHRNLVQFLGYCQEDGKSILVYEFMHNGTLKEHLYGPLTRERGINWIQRLEIAEDAARGIEYLHTGLDGASHVSSIVRGTVGYLDPEYYISQQLTDKSDVYSFGVILLELISGQEAISNENFGVNCRNIVQWAKMHIESGDIQGIIDPSLRDEYDIQSMWKIAEKALMCVQAHGHMRPSISEVLKEVQDAIMIDKEAKAAREGNSNDMSIHSMHSSLHLGSSDLGPTDSYLSIDESIARPSAR